MSRTICVVTGSRADYGLLYWLMKEIKADPECKLQVAVTGMHLATEFGLTYEVIETDGFTIDAKIETVMSSDTSTAVAKSIGIGVIGFADALQRLHPDILVVLGDRTEILAAVQAALICRIPVAHIGGGDSTEGAYDESIRHSITKMSHIHFTTNIQSASRVRQMGENPANVHNVGSPGVDCIRKLQLLKRAELEAALNLTFKAKNLLITVHPATLSATSPEDEYREVLKAVESLGEDIGLIFTHSNSDHGGRELIRMTKEFVDRHDNAASFVSLGQVRYLSLMAQADAIVGNSSSGLYEAPSFCKPTVNIGDRQKGRIKATSVLDCVPKAAEIKRVIAEALEKDCTGTVNPYGDGDSSYKIKCILKKISEPQKLLVKRFFDSGFEQY